MAENETTFLVSSDDNLNVKYARKSSNNAKATKKKDDKLGKELSLIHGVGLIVGSIIGSGIFISPNGVLQEAGSYGMALIMWIIGGLLAAGGGLCLCELGNFVKKSGCEYAYIKEGFSFNNRNHYVTLLGDVLSFLFTWTSTFCIRPMSIAIQMLTFGNYVVKPFFLECDVPEEIIKMASVTAMDIQSTGVWPLLTEFDDPELTRLASQLPATLLKSRADSSVKKYLGAYRRWRAWAMVHELPTFPAKEHHVALYLQSIGQRLESKSAAEEAVNALTWVHSLAGLDSPTDRPFVQATLQGLRRMWCKPVQKRKPMTIEILADMVQDTNSHPSLSNLRLTTFSLLAFAGFLRFDEAIHIRACDVMVTKDMAKVSLPRSKTDQLRQGHEVLIARTNTLTCPVAMLERYMEAAEVTPTSDLYLFRGICKGKAGEKLRASGCLSYTTVRELFKKRLVDLGHSPEGFGLHSLRAGGASAAAQAGIPDRLFKQHGRWSSDSAKDGYIEDSKENRLSVSKNIGI